VKGPYREPTAKLRGDTPDRLECWLRDGDKGRWVRVAYVKLWFVLLACTTLAATSARLAALPLGLLGLLWASRDWAQRKGTGVVFTINQGRIEVSRDGGTLAFELDEIEDVRLDTKSTSKNVTMARADGVNTLFGFASNHNIELDVSRIELAIAGSDDVLLCPAYINSSLCAETLRSIRLFLRAHGWKPLDERT